jgi:hypothetical protein
MYVQREDAAHVIDLATIVRKKGLALHKVNAGNNRTQEDALAFDIRWWVSRHHLATGPTNRYAHPARR